MKEKKVSIISEEDLKQKIVLPYIESLGFTLDQIELEKSLKIKLGRNIYCINKDKNKKRKEAKGRLDILCKIDNRNIFVVEVKKYDKKITKEDIDQGLSYARLLEKIAPFVLITNGIETKVIDTISREELSGENIGNQSTFWENGCQLSVEEELKYRYEALQGFVGYSYENLKLFSLSQIKDRMSVLKGNKDDLGKKYIPELFLKNLKLYQSLENFLETSSNNQIVYSIVGDSGIGKTNQVCYLAEEYSSKYLVLFFNGANIYNSITDEIKEDFNWIFSPQLTAKHIFDRLSYLADMHSTKCIFFIDAIDEIPYQHSLNDLNNLCRRIKNYQNIRLCITCKTSVWKVFLEDRTNPTILKEQIFKSEKYNSLDASFELTKFNDDEIKKLNKKYKDIFKLKSDIRGQIKEECKLGFTLRVVAEVYSGKEIPESISDVSLLKEYLKRKIRSMKKENQSIANNLLKEIGNIFIEQEKEGNKTGRISELTLKKKLNIPILSEIPEELFSYDILTKNEDNEGCFVIGFYYTKLRDFIIAIYSLKLSNISENEFRNILPYMMKGPIGISALHWYLPRATILQKNIMLNYKKGQAGLLVDKIETLMEKDFLYIKNRFEPKTNGKIGIVISDIKSPFIEAFGFRKINNEEEKVLAVRENNKGKEFFEQGVRVVNYFTKHTDPKEKAKEIIMEQLKKIVEKGLLNEKYNVFMLEEKILSLLYYYGDNLGINKPKDRLLPRYDSILPIDLEDIQNRIKKLLPEIGDNTKVKYLHNEYDKDYLYNIIYGYIEDMIEIGVTTIYEPVLPVPDINLEEINDKIIKMGGEFLLKDICIAQYSNAQLKKYIEKFFELYIKEYNKIVEICLPGMKNNLSLYKAQPFHLIIEYNRFKQNNFTLTYGYNKNKTDENIFEVYINPDNSLFNQRGKIFNRIYFSTIERIFLNNIYYLVSSF